MDRGLAHCGWVIQTRCHQGQIEVVHVGHDKHFLLGDVQMKDKFDQGKLEIAHFD